MRRDADNSDSGQGMQHDIETQKKQETLYIERSFQYWEVKGDVFIDTVVFQSGE